MMESSSTSIDIPFELREFVKELFDAMLLNFGKKFTDQWGSVSPEAMKEHWCRGLLGYTRREVRRGLAEIDNLTWPPTFPEFKKLCRPPIDFVYAYYEALEGIRSRDNGEVGVWSHPAIFWASRCLYFDLKSKSFSDVKVRWEKVLDDELAKGSWEKIPEPNLAIEYKKEMSVPSKEKAKEFLAIAGEGILEKKTPTLNWAYKILEETKNKTREYPQISIDFAKKALEEYQ